MLKKPSVRLEEQRVHFSTITLHDAVGIVLDEMAELERKRFEFLLELQAQNRGLMFREQVVEQYQIYLEEAEKLGVL